MTNLKKRNGEMQKYDAAKLEASITRAGASDDLARAVAARVQVTEGMLTEQIRQRIAEELRKTGPQVAEAYALTTRLPARLKPEVSTGAVRVPQLLPRIPDARASPRVWVSNQSRKVELRPEAALTTHEIWMNRAEFEKLGAVEGSRLAVRFQPPAPATTSTGGQAQPAQVAPPSPPKAPA